MRRRGLGSSPEEHTAQSRDDAKTAREALREALSRVKRGDCDWALSHLIKASEHAASAERAARDVGGMWADKPAGREASSLLPDALSTGYREFHKACAIVRRTRPLR